MPAMRASGDPVDRMAGPSGLARSAPAFELALSATRENEQPRNCPQQRVPRAKLLVAPVPFWLVPCPGFEPAHRRPRHSRDVGFCCIWRQRERRTGRLLRGPESELETLTLSLTDRAARPSPGWLARPPPDHNRGRVAGGAGWSRSRGPRDSERRSARGHPCGFASRTRVIISIVRTSVPCPSTPPGSIALDRHAASGRWHATRDIPLASLS
jgi:hypothetical protein